MQDLRLAFRHLRASSIVSTIAIFSLALGIGANIFSLIDRLVLRQLPDRDAYRLVLLVGPERPQASWSNPAWERSS